MSSASLISVYGKARREEEALAVFEEMFDAGVKYLTIGSYKRGPLVRNFHLIYFEVADLNR